MVLLFKLEMVLLAGTLLFQTGISCSVNDWINDIYVREEMEQEKDEDA